VLDRLLVELPGEEREEAPFPDEEALSNRALEEEWEAARRDRERLLAAPDRFPALVLPAAEPGGEAPLLPPLWFCPAAGRLFPIACPRCRGPLRTCRDDARLAAAGLPVYSTTAARFLCCPACGEGGEGEDGAAEPRFWAGPAAEARGLAGVATLEDLRRELAELPPGAPQGEGHRSPPPRRPPAGPSSTCTILPIASPARRRSASTPSSSAWAAPRRRRPGPACSSRPRARGSTRWRSSP
jgi:hypothetical protein